MKLQKQYLIPVAIGLVVSGLGFSFAWTAGYQTAQRSAYNQTLRGLLSLARNTDQIAFAKQVSDFGAAIGRRSDYLQFSLEHPGTYTAAAQPPDPGFYEKTLREEQAKYPKPIRPPAR